MISIAPNIWQLNQPTNKQHAQNEIVISYSNSLYDG